jgi:hypothetical protein
MTEPELVSLRAPAAGAPGEPRARLFGALRRAQDRRTQDRRAKHKNIAAIVIHPTSNFMAHYLMGLLPAAGISLLALNTRYLGNDSQLIFERVIADLGAGVRFLRDKGFDKVILLGNSGGASTVAFYQTEAENLTLTDTPAGDPVTLSPDDLPPADGIALFGAHPGRALVLEKWLDASVTDEADSLSRDPALDIYDPANGPPFSADFVAALRAAQTARSTRITAWVRQRLAAIRAIPEGPRDEGFVVHRTCADPRLLDPLLDANDRAPDMVWGDPRTLNQSVNDVARFTTLTSWLSQWSLESRAHGPACITQTSVPVLNVEFTADTNVLPSDIAMWTAALGDRQTLHRLIGGTHFLIGQPDHRQTLTAMITDWTRQL